MTDGFAAGLGQFYGNIDNLAIASGAWCNVDWYDTFFDNTSNNSGNVDAEEGC